MEEGKTLNYNSCGRPSLRIALTCCITQVFEQLWQPTHKLILETAYWETFLQNFWLRNLKGLQNTVQSGGRFVQTERDPIHSGEFPGHLNLLRFVLQGSPSRQGVSAVGALVALLKLRFLIGIFRRLACRLLVPSPANLRLTVYPRYPIIKNAAGVAQR